MVHTITRFFVGAALVIGLSGCAGTGTGSGGGGSSAVGLTDVLVGSKGLLRDASPHKGHKFEQKFDDLSLLTGFADKLR